MRTESSNGLVGNLRALWGVYRELDPNPGSGKGGAAPGVAVVLGAQVLPGGLASGALVARTLHAARLYLGGEVGLVVPTGGLGDHPPAEAEIMVRILREAGVPEAGILPEGEALNTWDSARLVAGMAREMGLPGRVLVVTDPLHCVRTVAAFGEAGLPALAEPVYSSPMWREGWSRRGQLAREAGALVWYRVRHGVGSRPRR